jgi:hypothetical protein
VERKRFIIRSNSNGWNGSVYADRFEPHPESFCGNFYVGSQLVAQVEIPTHEISVSDSGGRLQIVA